MTHCKPFLSPRIKLRFQTLHPALLLFQPFFLPYPNLYPFPESQLRHTFHFLQHQPLRPLPEPQLYQNLRFLRHQPLRPLPEPQLYQNLRFLRHQALHLLPEPQLCRPPRLLQTFPTRQELRSFPKFHLQRTLLPVLQLPLLCLHLLHLPALLPSLFEALESPVEYLYQRLLLSQR